MGKITSKPELWTMWCGVVKVGQCLGFCFEFCLKLLELLVQCRREANRIQVDLELRCQRCTYAMGASNRRVIFNLKAGMANSKPHRSTQKPLNN